MDRRVRRSVVYGAGARTPLRVAYLDVRRVGVGVLAGNVALAVLVAAVLIAGWLPLTAARRRRRSRSTAVALGFALRPVPRECAVSA